MRVLFTSVMMVVFLVIQYLDNPGIFESTAQFAGDVWQRNLQEKEVRLEGLTWLSRTEVERVLPMDRSVLWWMFNTPVVQARVAESPWIGAVSVERCSQEAFSAWGCFVVSIKERAPRFLAVVDEEAWILSKDGTFLVPVSSAMKESADARYRGLVVIENLASRQQSPDLVRSQMALASHAVETVEKGTKQRVRALRFEGQGDVAITFERLPFPVVFSASREGGVPLDEQAERCSKLVAQLTARLGEVERIDLAFSQVGVVKFKNSRQEQLRSPRS